MVAKFLQQFALNLPQPENEALAPICRPDTFPICCIAF